MSRRALLVLPVMVTTLVLAGCNNGSSGSSNNQPSTPGSGTSSGASAPSPSCTIPQNNGGDHDADNNGGPDDGDGCDV
jgi:hypothetical protein